MRHPLLDHHDVIAWDMDGTLIDGPHSHFFRAYIMAHPEKTHHIVTFRDRLWAMRAPLELALFHRLPTEHIAGVHDCPQNLWQAYVQRESFYQPDLVDAYLIWKGKKAAELGCTVLVDDMAEQVIKGCELHSVAFIHALDPAFRGL